MTGRCTKIWRFIFLLCKSHSLNLYTSWVLPGMLWLWMSVLHLSKLNWKFKRISGNVLWSGCCMFAVAIDLIVHHIWDILRLKKAENSSGQHPFLYQRRRTSASSDTLSRWLKHDKLTLSSTAFFLHHVPMYDWTLGHFQFFFPFFYIKCMYLRRSNVRFFFSFSPIRLYRHLDYQCQFAVTGITKKKHYKTKENKNKRI